MEHITVYHGTTITNCNSIMKNKKFKESISRESIYQSIVSKKNTYQWLGDGIYYTIKKGVKVKDFNQNTKIFLCEAGFNEEDNISEMFEEFLKENAYDINKESLYSTTMTISVPLTPTNEICSSCYDNNNDDDVDTILIKKGKFHTSLKDWGAKQSLYHGLDTYKSIAVGGIY